MMAKDSLDCPSARISARISAGARGMVAVVGRLLPGLILCLWIETAWSGGDRIARDGIDQERLGQHGMNWGGIDQERLGQNGMDRDGIDQGRLDRDRLDQDATARDRTVFVYGARWTDNRWVDIMRGQTEFEDSYLGAVGVSQVLRRFSEDLLLEAEVSLARHWGEQDHFEVNAALNLRWSRFPWDRWVDTTFAYGLGPSYAFAKPAVEAEPDQPASRGLVFMVTELTFAPPHADGRWAGLLRIHHRSGAFDLVSEASGSNFIATGIRYRY